VTKKAKEEKPVEAKPDEGKKEKETKLTPAEIREINSRGLRV
jgi:hypothetical protein